MLTRHALIRSVIGDLTVVATGDAIVGLYFPDHWYMPPADRIGNPIDARDDTLLSTAEQQLTEYLSGARRSFELPTSTHGDAMQERVWEMLRGIPFGETTTYGALAIRLGNRALAQAVGQAVGHNPISIIIACHRVVGASGKLTGFAGGLERKRFLLELEEPELARSAKLF